VISHRPNSNAQERPLAAPFAGIPIEPASSRWSVLRPERSDRRQKTFSRGVFQTRPSAFSMFCLSSHRWHRQAGGYPPQSLWVKSINIVFIPWFPHSLLEPANFRLAGLAVGGCDEDCPALVKDKKERFGVSPVHCQTPRGRQLYCRKCRGDVPTLRAEGNPVDIKRSPTNQRVT